ncbi:MAG: DoxX family protein [Lewinellaceae bacterium]|nr:DoxX family protein [Saprospiraceae bacterium]MCB9340992.1 DoxX family protein [Lewinellaceae bacterium]
MINQKIFFWIATAIIFFWCGVMTVVFFGSEEQKMAMEHYGYPPYFGTMLNVFSIIGAVALVLPAVPARLKEWAYFGFALNFIGASVSNWAVDGFSFQVIFPLLFFVPLGISYFLFHKMEKAKAVG